MRNLRKYGDVPFTVAVIHGGPGAAGEMAPVARELSSICGILEPLQTAISVQGQIQELQEVLQTNANLPVTLIGYSWGAWLSYMLAAQYPELVGKLILVSSGAFEEKYILDLMKIRLSRLSETEREKACKLIEMINDPKVKCKDSDFGQFGALMSKSDTYKALPVQKADVSEDIMEVKANVYQGVWTEAAGLRRSGKLLQLAKSIRCPVVAIHGDYDPTPAEGVEKPLAEVIKDFHFILLKHCGHTPWIECEAKDTFYKIIKEQLNSNGLY